MVAKSAGVDSGGDKGMPQGVHLYDGGHLGRVPVVVAIQPLGEGGAGRGLHSHKTDLFPLFFLREVGKAESGKVASSSHASDEDIGFHPDLFQLRFGLQPDDRLVENDMVEYAAQRIPGIFPFDGIIHGLADGDPQAPRRIRVLGQDHPSGLGLIARAGGHLGAPRFHHHSAVGLLLVAHLDHIHLALQPENVGRKGQRAPPLSRARLRAEPLHSFFLVVVSLSYSRVRLMASRRAHPFIFVVDARRGFQRFFQPFRPAERRRPPEFVNGQYFFRNVDPALLAHLLLDQPHGEDGSQVLRPQGL